MNLCYKIFIFLLAVTFNFKIFAQHTEIQSSFSTNLTTCLNQSVYTVNVNNISPYNLFEVNVKLVLPTGISYIANSVTGATENGRIGDTLLFTMSDLASLNRTSFSVKISATCMDSYLSKKNTFILAYKGRNVQGALIQNSTTHYSNLYNVNAPDLSLVAMTNQSINGNIGDVFTRCITITNGGSGSLSNFELEHIHGSGLVISGVSTGTSSTIPNGTLHTFSAVDFASIGNRNGTLDPGESIVICETIKIVSCSNAQSNYKYKWGCNDDVCQSLSDAANIVFNAEAPRLQFTPWNSFTINSNSGLGANCYGNNVNGDFPSSLTITNVGVGAAKDALIQIGGTYAGSNVIMIADYYSSMNIASLTIEVNGGGQQPLVPNRTYASNRKACLPSDPKNAFDVIIPLINPGDVIVLRWNHFTCCADNCENGNRRHLLHWCYKGEYANNCGDTYPVPMSGNLPGSGGTFYYRNQLTPDVVPGTMINNQSSSVTFMAVNSEFTLPKNSSHKFKYRVTLPDECLTVDLNSLRVKNHNGVVQNVSYTSSTIGNQVEFLFNSIVMGSQWTVSFDLTLNCSTCPVQGNKNLYFETLYQPSSSCDCWNVLGCTTARIDALCPPICEGANLIDSKVKRINLGLPDNNNDGLPDAAPHNLSLVRTDRLMHGDTLSIASVSAINNPNNVNFISVVQKDEIVGYGNVMNYTHSKISVYKAATGLVYHSTNFNGNLSNSVVGGTKKWSNGVNISVAPGLNLPVGNYLEQGDSVWIVNYYLNATNIGGDIVTVNTKTEVKVSTNPTPVQATPAQLLGCNLINREFSLIGWYYTNYGPNTIETIDCNEIVIQQSYYLSIGPCCNNYNGGNLFPYEYRHWSSPANMFIDLPDDYEFVSASFNFSSTAGTYQSRGTSIPSITPVSVNGKIYEFDLSSYFGPVGSGAEIPFGDDGFSGTIFLRLKPSCLVENGTKNTRYRWAYNSVAQINPAQYDLTGWLTTDPVTYFGPILTMQSNVLYVNSQTGQDTWDLFFQNASPSSSVKNFWIAVPSNASITASRLINTTTNVTYYPNANGVFDVPDLGPESSVTYRLFTVMSNCNLSTIKVYSGWGCTGVPDKVSDYLCDPLELTLTIEVLTPSFDIQVNLLNPVIGNLCEDQLLELVVKNYQLGYGYRLNTEIILPYGMSFVPNSFVFSYLGQAYPLPAPTLISGSTYQWDLSSQPALANGLVGIVDSLSNFFKIYFATTPLCGFSSGQRIYGKVKGMSSCGSEHQSELNYSVPILINDMIAPYATDIRIGIDFITPCGPDNNTILSIVNNGPLPFGNADSITYVLPAGLTYVPNSFVPLHNATIAQTEPRIVNQGVQTLLVWPLKSGVITSDSMTFQLNLLPTPSEIPCEITELRAFTNIFLTANCTLDGNVCEAGLITGESSKSIYVYKTLFQNVSISSSTNRVSGNEMLIGTARFENLGAPLSNNYPIVYQIINDADVNGVLDSSDPIIKTDTLFVNVSAGGFFDLNFTASANQLCKGFVRFYAADNPCICSSQLVAFELEPAIDTFHELHLCDSTRGVVTNAYAGGDSYLWSPTNHLSIDSATPWSASFLYSLPDTNAVDFTYFRTYKRGLCSYVDTFKVNVYGAVYAEFGLSDTVICHSTNMLEVPILYTREDMTKLLTYTINGVSQIDTVLTNNFLSVDASNATTYILRLDKINRIGRLECERILTEEIEVRVLPEPNYAIDIIGPDLFCMNDSTAFLTLEFRNGTPEFTLDYLLNGISFQGLTTNSKLNIPVPTGQVGQIEFISERVTDSYSVQCSLDLEVTSMLTVLPLPKAIIEGNRSVCQEDADVPVLFTGSNALGSSYTFNYLVNGNAFQGVGQPTFETLQTTNQDGIFEYHLLNVVDDSSIGCRSEIDTVIQINVNRSPIAEIIGNNDVCFNAPESKVTFVGSLGVAPYTFTYQIGMDEFTIVAPTDSAHIFIPTQTLGTVTIALLKVVDSGPLLCYKEYIDASVAVHVLPNPEARIEMDTVVCQFDGAVPVVFYGTNASSTNYTFQYEVNGVVQQGNGTPNFETLQSTNIVGDFVYHLSSVTDHSPATCKTDLDTLITVHVSSQPNAQISGDTIVCNLSTPPNVLFTGANGLAPYTFTYRIGADEFTAVAPVNTVHVPISTQTVGAVIIELVKVTDSSPTACYQLLTGKTVTIEILPNPTARIEMDTVVCQNSNTQVVKFIGGNTVPNYTFTYSLNNGANQTIVSSGNQAQVMVPTGNVGQFSFHLLNVQDAGIRTCSILLDTTIVVEVLPLPIVHLSGNNSTCQLADQPEVVFETSNSTGPYWVFYSLNGVTDSLELMTRSSVFQPTNNSGDFVYQLIGVKDGGVRSCYQAFTDSIQINILELPTANISLDTAVCKNSGDVPVTFIGGSTTSPFIFTYSVNGTPQTVTSTNNQVLIQQSSALAGEYVYHLTKVTDASTQACFRILDTTITIKINELPIATIGSDAIVCLNDTPANINFVGELGTPDYTFHYSIIETNEQLTVQSGNGFTATVPSINNQIGNYTYTLTGVTDASDTRCYTSLNQSITIQVKGLPSGDLSTFLAVCQDEEPQELLFSGSNGGSPYIFNYTLNGVAATVRTIAPDSTVTVVHSTTVPGNFVYHLTHVTESDFGCSSVLNKIVNAVIHPKPEVQFTYQPSYLKTSESLAIFQNQSNGAVVYNWHFGDGDSSNLPNPSHLFDIEGKDYVEVQLLATTNFGCVDSTTMRIKVRREPMIYIPNTFTPNGDEVNNHFYPILSEGIELEDFSFLIFNRWGEIIFETNDIFKGWDGIYKGKIVPDGLYSYKIQVKHIGSSVREDIIGHINVLK